jgi:hypothetical protein
VALCRRETSTGQAEEGFGLFSLQQDGCAKEETGLHEDTASISVAPLWCVSIHHVEKMPLRPEVFQVFPDGAVGDWKAAL